MAMGQLREARASGLFNLLPSQVGFGLSWG